MSTRFGFVSTFPPTQCGLATFTTSLRDALLTQRADCSGGSDDQAWVVRLVEAPTSRSGGDVVAQLVQGDAASLDNAVSRLDQCDVAIIQHEYGIYGGSDGDEILSLLAALRAPSIVVLHTVLTAPSPHQREVLEAVARLADAVVTMTATARNRLANLYDVDMRKVSVIPHGAPDLEPSNTAPAVRTSPFTVLTWGLIGPGKGIEWGIEAMGLLRAQEPTLDPAPCYVVAGQTHPKVALHEGEAYRARLQSLVRQLGLGQVVHFDSHYRDAHSLAGLVRSADVVLLPYDSTDQVTSGVLIEAVAAGKPVVATAFPHAVELLGGGAGAVVRHRDPASIADALRTIITNPAVAADMARAAASAGPQLRWSAIAGSYRALARQLLKAGVAA